MSNFMIIAKAARKFPIRKIRQKTKRNLHEIWSIISAVILIAFTVVCIFIKWATSVTFVG